MTPHLWAWAIYGVCHCVKTHDDTAGAGIAIVAECGWKYHAAKLVEKPPVAMICSTCLAISNGSWVPPRWETT